MNGIHNLSTGPHEEIQVYEWLFLETAEGSFPVILCDYCTVILKNTIMLNDEAWLAVRTDQE